MTSDIRIGGRARNLHAGLLAAIVSALLLAPGLAAPPPARAQSGGPTEPAIEELRTALIQVLAIDRQRQLLGANDAEAPLSPEIREAQLTLLRRQYSEQLLPWMTALLTDCFNADYVLGQVIGWARQVELLGLAEEGQVLRTADGLLLGEAGPLHAEARALTDLLVEVLKACHQQFYERCVLDDMDPAGGLLGGLTRQLALLGVDDLSYQNHWFNCEYGWHGTVSINEWLEGGTQSRHEVIGGMSASTSHTVVGARVLLVTLEHKKAPGTGQTNGRVSEVTQTIARTPDCTTTGTNERGRVMEGAGPASFSKSATRQGALTLTIAGPEESGTERQDIQTETSCFPIPRTPPFESPLPSMLWHGVVTGRVEDPLAERIAGSTRLAWAINAVGQATPARTNEQGETVRVPAIPGAASAPAQIHPWIHIAPVALDGQAPEFPTIIMEVTWNLAFGQP